jgi:hypothetical protein
MSAMCEFRKEYTNVPEIQSVRPEQLEWLPLIDQETATDSLFELALDCHKRAPRVARIFAAGTEKRLRRVSTVGSQNGQRSLE